jgi:hypothetical protein
MSPTSWKLGVQAVVESMAHPPTNNLLPFSKTFDPTNLLNTLAGSHDIQTKDGTTAPPGAEPDAEHLETLPEREISEFREHLRPDGKLGISKSKDLPETKLPNGVHVYNGSLQFLDNAGKLVEEFRDIFEDNGPIDIPEDHQMRIPLVEGWQNHKIGKRPYYSSEEDRKLIDELMDGLHARGRAEWVNTATPFGSPIFVVWRTVHGQRKGRIVVDLRALNKVTVPDAYPLPLQSEVIRKIRGKAYLSVVDASLFFYQFMVYPPHQDRFTVVSHRGQERFKVAIMGFRNSPAHVQRYMDHLLRPHRAFATAFIDDMIVFSDSAAEHIRHLRTVFKLFQDKNISLSSKKSFLGYPSVELLGFRVDGLGLYNTSDRIKTIRELRFPATLQQLEKFIGLTGYLRHLIPRYSQRVNPLQRRKTAMLSVARTDGKLPKGSSRKQYTRRADFTPTKEELNAFTDLQAALTGPNALFHQDPDRPLFIQLDASKEVGFSGICFQLADGQTWDGKSPIPRAWIRPVLYLSKTLNTAERKYWPTELEVACLVWLVRKLRTIIGSNRVQPVHILTDHAATVGIVNQTSMETVDKTKMNLKLVLASEYLSQHQLDVHHIPGTTNIIADALSRLPTYQQPVEDEGVLDNLLEFAIHSMSETKIDPDFKEQLLAAYSEHKRWSQIIQQLQQSDSEAKLPFTLDGRGLLYLREFTGKHRLCIPSPVADTLIAEAHDSKHHFGVDRVYHDLTDLYVIKNCKRKIAHYIDNCPVCSVNRNDNQKPLGEMQPILSPPTPFHTISIDFVTSLPDVPAALTPWQLPRAPFFDAFMSVTDKYSKASLIIPGNAIYTATDWATIMLRTLYLSNWGIPKRIISDRDRKFMSEFWQGLWQHLQTKLLFSTAWHPQTDGQSEVKNRTVEIAIRMWATTNPDSEWTDIIPSLQFNLNNAYNRATKCTANQLLYGFNPSQLSSLADECPPLLREMYQEEAQIAIAEAQMAAKMQYDHKHRRKQFHPGDWVYISLGKGYNLPGHPPRKFSQQRMGPVQVQEKVGVLAYKLRLPPHINAHDVVSVTQLSPAQPPASDPYHRDPPFGEAVEVEDDQGEGLEAFKHYEVERIIQRRDRKVGRGATTVEYLIKWADHPNQYNVWMPAKHMRAAELIQDFEARRAQMAALRQRAHGLEAREPPLPKPGEVITPRGPRKVLDRVDQDASPAGDSKQKGTTAGTRPRCPRDHVRRPCCRRPVAQSKRTGQS